MKRHENALGIMEGARNVRAIAKSLLDAANEAAGEGIGAEQDAAVRMIVYRLARLCKVDEIAYGYNTVTLSDTYCTLMNECKSRVNERTAGAAEPGRVVEAITQLRPRSAELPEGVEG
jgi:hypothetical protein